MQLMQQRVQKSSTTTRPLRSASLIGLSVLSQAVPPSNSAAGRRFLAWTATKLDCSVIGARVAGFAYAGLAGEPALGPVAFMHRPSAANDPLAPLGHHWQDAAHESFGVLTLGVFTRALRLEGSLFNPREADENHLVADFRGAKLDSYAARLSWAAWPAGAGAAPWCGP